MEIDQKEEAATPTLVDKDGKELEAQLLPQRIRDLHQQRNQETTTIIQNTASLLTEHSAMLLPKEMKIKEDNEIKAYYAVDFLGVRHRVIDHYIPQIICQIDTWISLLLQSGYRRGDTHQERNFRNNILVSIRFFSILLSKIFSLECVGTAICICKILGLEIKWFTGEAIVICHMIMIGKRFFFRNRPYRKDGGVAIRNLDLKFMTNEVSGAFSVNVFLAFVFPFAIMHQEGRSIPYIAKMSCFYIIPLMLAKVHMGMNYASDIVITSGVGILFNYLSLLCREIPYLDDLISAPKHVPTQPEGSYMKLYVCGMIFFLSALISANYPLYLSYRYPAILGRIVGPYLVYLYESIKKSPAVYDGYTTSLSIVSSIGHLGVTVYILSNKPRSRNPFKLMMYYGITFIVEVTLSSIVLVAFQ